MNGATIPFLMLLFGQIPSPGNNPALEWGQFFVNLGAIGYFLFYFKKQSEALAAKNERLQAKLFTVLSPAVGALRHFLARQAILEAIAHAQKHGVEDNDALVEAAIKARTRVESEIPQFSVEEDDSDK